MLYLATASGPAVRDAMKAGLLGQMRQPGAGNAVIPTVPWAADNGCFNAKTFTFGKWVDWLETQEQDECLFAVVPDVVGDHVGTLDLWHSWARVVQSFGYNTAFVAQDGCRPQDVPLEAHCVFIGGSTEFKVSPVARQIVFYGKANGMWTHMGRVNTKGRLRLAHEWGCDSVDGTYLAFGPDVNLPRLLRWLGEIEDS